MRNEGGFDLFLFSTDAEFIERATAAGITGFIVDWEYIGKDCRQLGCDTQINHDSPEDLERVRASTDKLVLCRINRFGPYTTNEIDIAIGAGADEILLPMARTVEEVQKTLDFARGRCGVGILVETVAAVNLAGELAKLPLSRVYMGLNDLAIDRKSNNIFKAVVDGTLESTRLQFTMPFGFGGLTVPEGGFPIPCRLLIGEMSRVNCDFSFLRRSFLRDTAGRDLNTEVPGIFKALDDARTRSSSAVAMDRRDLEVAVENFAPKLKDSAL